MQARAGQEPLPSIMSVIDPVGGWTGAGMLAFPFLRDNIVLPELKGLFADLSHEVRTFGATFKPIAYEALLDAPLFLAGTGAIALPATLVPGIWKVPAIVPGAILSGYSIWRFARFVTRIRTKSDYLDTLRRRYEREDNQEALDDLKTLVNRVGEDKAAEITFDREAEGLAAAQRHQRDIERKKFLAAAEFSDIYHEYLNADLPQVKRALEVQMIAAATNILAYANTCLPVSGWREQAKCYQVLREREVQTTTALDTLRFLSNGLYKVRGLLALQDEAKKHFMGV